MKSEWGYPSFDKPWLKYYSDSAINAPLPECTIYEYLLENNKDYPSDIAIIYLGRKITYKELFDNIDKTTAAFLKLGVKEKEIVTVALPSIPEALYCVYALNKIGAVANMIHPLAGTEETVNYFNEVQSRIAVIFDGAYDNIVNDIERTSVEKVVVASPADSLPLHFKIAYNLKVKSPRLDGNRFINWKEFIRDGFGTTVKVVKKDCHEMAIISHTGGTTGEPKGCMISDHSTNAEIWQVGMTMYPSRQECMLAVLPPFVNYSLTNGMFEPLAFGMKLVLLPKYEPLKFADYVIKYKVNHVNTIPAYCEAMLQIPDIEKKDLSSLKYVVYGGEGMTEEVENSVNVLLKRCGCKYSLKKGLGMTEATSAASASFENLNDFESVGIPFPKMIKKTIDTETFEETKYGVDGEICISGPTIMQGYYRKEEETAEIIREHADGKKWLHTGDLGHISEDGIIFVTGRIKRIIMTKGSDGNVTKMFPDRIEKAIHRHDSVEISCVIGVPDKERINYPKAFVTIKKSDSDKASKEHIKTEILDICKQSLPDYMVPNEIEFLENMPRTSLGKIDYRALEIQNKT
ncbi:MAG: acyl--CoA ligase [Lachnospiraceae bacterium]|nr:acyl--CoA ligase [Lachnospiraceae bacterium]